MNSINCVPASGFSLVVVFILKFSSPCASFDFDRTYFGVLLETDVHYLTDGSLNVTNPQSLYSTQTIKTMLTVISGKFSKVFVSGPLTTNDRYVQNFTYFHGSKLPVFAGEAAAKINQKSYGKNLSVLYDIQSQETPERMEASILLAFEAASRANEMFPNTVEGICFDGKSLVPAQQTLNDLRSYHEKASRLDIKLGARLLRTAINREDKITGTVREIVTQSDFIVFDIIISKQNAEQGPVRGFQTLEVELLRIRDAVRQINTNVEVIANTYWPGSNTEMWEHVQNLQTFWETCSKWAAEHKYKIYLWEAFDNPSGDRAHLGWWRLKENSKIDMLDGYIEKIAEIVVRNTSMIPSTTETQTDFVFGGKKNSSYSSLDRTNNANKEDPTATDVSFSVWNEATIAITVVGSILVILVAVLLAFLFHRNNVQSRTCPVSSAGVTESDIRDFRRGATRQSSKSDAAMIDVVMTVPYDVSLEIPKEKLKIDTEHVLGTGQYGCVYKALIEWHEGHVTEVAVKAAKTNCPSMALKGLLSEIKILSYLGKHSNIVSLQGAYTAELINGIVYVATELCGLGSLESFLRNNAKNEFRNHRAVVNLDGAEEIELHAISSTSYLDMVRWAYETARGMQYLESKRVVHADLATRNVLLTSDKTAKITDFGLSRRMYNYMNYVKTNQEPLPWRWMAVESLKRFEFSSKSDVWSYGVTLWEIFSKGDVPYPGLSWTQDFVVRLLDGLRPGCPLFSSPEIYGVMQTCWKLKPEERPSFSNLENFFNDLRQNRRPRLHIFNKNQYQ